MIVFELSQVPFHACYLGMISALGIFNALVNLAHGVLLKCALTASVANRVLLAVLILM